VIVSKPTASCSLSQTLLRVQRKSRKKCEERLCRINQTAKPVAEGDCGIKAEVANRKGEDYRSGKYHQGRELQKYRQISVEDAHSKMQTKETSRCWTD